MKGLKIFLLIDYIVTSVLYFFCYYFFMESRNAKLLWDSREMDSVFLYLCGNVLMVVYVVAMIIYVFIQKRRGSKVHGVFILLNIVSFVLYIYAYELVIYPIGFFAETDPRSYIHKYLFGVAVALSVIQIASVLFGCIRRHKYNATNQQKIANDSFKLHMTEVRNFLVIDYLITIVLYFGAYNLYQPQKGLFAGLGYSPLFSFFMFIGANIFAFAYIVAMCLFVGADKENKWTYNIVAISSLPTFVLYCAAYFILFEKPNINQNPPRYLFSVAVALSIVQITVILVQLLRTLKKRK